MSKRLENMKLVDLPDDKVGEISLWCFEDLAREGYIAYGEQRNWLTYDNKKMPQWEEIGREIQEAWIAAAVAVTQARTLAVSAQIFLATRAQRSIIR